MGWGEGRASVKRFRHVPMVLLSTALLGGCFQPLYGTSTETGRPVVRDALSAIDVQQIHIVAAHAICGRIEQELFGPPAP